MSLPRPTSSLALLLVIVAAPEAQRRVRAEAPIPLPAAPGFNGLQVRHGIPFPMDPQKPIGRTIAGEFTETPHPDVVFLMGTRAYLLAEPDIYSSFVELPPGVVGAVNDLAVFPASDATQRDEILCVGPRGLHVLTFSAATDTFAPRSLRAGSEVPAWADARLVHVAPVFGPGARDVVAVGADGQDVLLLQETPGGHVDVLGFRASEEVHDLATIEWNGEAPRELVLMEHGAVSVHDALGTRLATFSVPGSVSSAIGVVQHGDEPRGRIAWVRTALATSEQYFALLGPDQPAPQNELFLSTLGCTGIAVGQLTPDFAPDVVLNNAFGPHNIALGNTMAQGAYGFALHPDMVAVYAVAPPGTDMSAQRGNPVLADFDADGDVDVAMGVQGTGQFTLQRNVWDPEYDQRFAFQSYDFPVPDGTPQTLEVVLEVPAVLDPDYSLLEVTVWEHDPVTLEALETPWDHYLTHVGSPGAITYATTQLPALDPALTYPPYSFVIRAREYGGSGLFPAATYTRVFFDGAGILPSGQTPDPVPLPLGRTPPVPLF